MDGKGQVCPLLIQIKILTAGEEAPKEFRCCWVSEKRTCPWARVPESRAVWEKQRRPVYLLPRYSQVQSPPGA